MQILPKQNVFFLITNGHLKTCLSVEKIHCEYQYLGLCGLSISMCVCSYFMIEEQRVRKQERETERNKRANSICSKWTMQSIQKSGPKNIDLKSWAWRLDSGRNRMLRIHLLHSSFMHSIAGNILPPGEKRKKKHMVANTAPVIIKKVVKDL